MLHQTSVSAEVFSFAKTQLNINVEPGEGREETPLSPPEIKLPLIGGFFLA